LRSGPAEAGLKERLSPSGDLKMDFTASKEKKKDAKIRGDSRR